jgi:hypothetical protein
MGEMHTENFDAGKWIQKAGLGFLFIALTACATSTTPPVKTGSEESFISPEEAVNAFVTASRAGNKSELRRILGPQGDKLISSGDPVADKNGRGKFLAAYDDGHKLESDGENKKILVIGNEEWPMPIPLVRTSAGWIFDTAAGEEEILNRRIGHNELVIIEICRTYVEAQREFSEQHQLPDGKVEYAEKFISSPGKHDGLYWPVSNGEEESPLGPLIADARTEGYVNAGKHAASTPYHGYYFKILKRQGSDAAGGAKNYAPKGRMTDGFAMVAFPAKYGDSGIMTFIVNQNGIVYQKNLGPHTAVIAEKMVAYNPDSGWKAP